MSAYTRQLSAAARQHKSTCDCCGPAEPDSPPEPHPYARDWELRRRLRVLRGRSAYVTGVQRHARNPVTGLYRFWIDQRGFDPLERMRMNRGPGHSSLPESSVEHREIAYAEARLIAGRRTLHALAQHETDLRVVAAYRDLPFFYS